MPVPLWRNQSFFCWMNLFNALDKEGQEKLSEIIRDMRDKGSLILLSSHDKDELENLSDVIYLVDSGRFKLK